MALSDAEYLARIHLSSWFWKERTEYSDQKYDKKARAEQKEATLETGVAPDSYWRDYILQYVHRAHVLGLDTLAGRQALAKACVVMFSCTERIIEHYGPLPMPGLPSGEVREWHR